MVDALKVKWKVYLMEAICLGLFMASASFFATILEYPHSWIREALPDDVIRTTLMGAAMGVTASVIIYSPMGKLSGAHMNPAVTFTFFRLGKIKMHDAFYYALFQCAGGILSVFVMSSLLGNSFKDPHVNYVITSPGKYGAPIAFVTEVVIAFCMMTMVLVTSNHPRLSNYTGIFAGIFVAAYVVLTGPISGFGMNPARSLASAIPAMQFPSFWIYLTAPFIGMFSAASVYRFFKGTTVCAKFYHSSLYQCIFNCGYCKHQYEDAQITNTYH